VPLTRLTLLEGTTTSAGNAVLVYGLRSCVSRQDRSVALASIAA